MKLILGSIVMAFVIAITMSYAYGEEVPVKVPFDTTGFSCTLSEELIYDCRFYGIKLINVTGTMITQTGETSYNSIKRAWSSTITC